MEKKLQNTLIEVLKQDERFVSQDGYLLKNTIREKAEKLDENLISLLLENNDTRKVFFKPIKDVIVFDSKKFVQFVNNKEFLPDSYTSFKNKIWLTNKIWDYISSSNEVVLSFPFKDCVLAWWQDKEDSKRQETFYNEILWQDEIDRLLDDKVFTKYKRIDKNWEHKLDWFNKDNNWTIKDNLIIKWNNLLALHSLKKQFANKVKLIYIDPPYNTGNDSFGYNDRFNHSTWLTFMKNRLEVAKDLLKDDWVIFISCDDREEAYLKVLMDEVFGRENFYSNIIWETRFNPVSMSKKISDIHEYLLVYTKTNNFKLNLLERTEKQDSRYKNIDNDNRWPWASDNLTCWPAVKNKIYKLKIPSWRLVEPSNWLSWLFKKERMDEMIKDWRIWFWKNWDNFPRYKRFLSEVQSWVVPTTLWKYSDIWGSQHSAKENKNLFWEKTFDYSKPENLIQRIIEISTNPWDIVLDYHLWSWTTTTVAHKMKRQYIGIEQMDYIQNITVERMKKVINWEQWWISKNVNWEWWWDFIYMETMESNQIFINKINKAQDKQALLDIYSQIKQTWFINYDVDIQAIDENIQEFKNLSIDHMKQFLIELLDKNLLYVNYSEMEDETYNIDNEDKKLNDLFYKG